MSKKVSIFSCFAVTGLFLLTGSFAFGQAQPAVMATGARLQGGGIPGTAAPAPGAPAPPAPGAPMPGAPAAPQAPALPGAAAPNAIAPTLPGAILPGTAAPNEVKPEKKPIVLQTVSTADLVYSLHEKPVTALAFAREGKVCISGSVDTTAQAWMTQDVFINDNTAVNGVNQVGANNANLAGFAQNQQFPGQNVPMNQANQFNQQNQFNQANQPTEKRKYQSGDYRAGQRIFLYSEGHKQGITDVLLDSTEDNLLTASYDGTLRRWIATKESSKKRYTGAKDRIWGAALDASDTYIAAACNDGNVYFWTAGPGKKLGVLETKQGPVFDVDIAPESSRVATAGADFSVKIFAVPAMKPLRTITGHQDKVFSVQFSPDGRYLLSASKDKTARIWDAHTGMEVARMVGHVGAVRKARFLMDKYVVTAGDDKTVRVWTLPDSVNITSSQTLDSRLGVPNAPNAPNPNSNGPALGGFGPMTRMADSVDDASDQAADETDYEGLTENIFGDEPDASAAAEAGEKAENPEKTEAEPKKQAVPKGIETVRYETGAPVFSLAVCPEAIAAGCQNGEVDVWYLPGPLAEKPENETPRPMQGNQPVPPNEDK